MTIRMLQAWNGYPQQAVTTLTSAEELRLVDLGLASYDLDGPADNLRLAHIVTTDAGSSSVLGGFNEIAANSLCIIGDSISAQMHDVPTSFGANSVSIASIVASGDQIIVETTGAHGYSDGANVRLAGIATAHPLSNRRFDIGIIDSTHFYLKGVKPSDYSSSIAGSAGTATLDAAYSNYSLHAVANFLLCHAFAPIYNNAIAGRVSSQVLANLQAECLDLRTRWVSVMVGLNDYATGVPSATTIDNLRSIYTQCLANGSRIIAFTVTPQTTMTTGGNGNLMAVNKWIRDFCEATPGMLLVDAHGVMLDPSSADGVARAGITYDSTHPDSDGAWWIGKLLADTVRPYVKPEPRPIWGNQTLTNNALANGKCTGTGGTAGTGVSGTVAASWSVGQRSSANVTATVRKQQGMAKQWLASTAYSVGDVVMPVPDTGYHYVCTTAGTSGASAPSFGTTRWGTFADNTVTWTTIPQVTNGINTEWQFIDVTASAGTTEYIQMYQTLTLPTNATLAVGALVRAQARLRFIDSSWKNFHLRLRAINGSAATIGNAWDMGKQSFRDADKLIDTGFDGLLMTPDWVIPAGTVTMQYIIEIGVASGQRVRAMVTDAAVMQV